jgi:NDP-sugar pyrophosphorylase family protein
MNYLTGMLRSFERNKLNKQLVIPMSGMGNRFIAAGYGLPKPLIEVAGKPIIQHVLEMYPNWENILFIVNSDHIDDKMLNLEEKLLDLAPNAKIHVVAPHKLGPTNAVLEAKESLISDGPIVINYCDFAGIFDLQEYEKKIFEYDSVLLTYTGFHPHMLRSTKFAYLKKINKEFVDIQEKQNYTDSPMDEEASAGAYSFRNRQLLIDSIQTQIDCNFVLGGELYTSLTVKALIQNGGTISTTLMSKFFQWGTPEDLEDFKLQQDFFRFRLKRQKTKSDANRIEILAAGAGKRFIDAGYNDLKPFLPVGENFLALQAIEALGNSVSKKGILLQGDQKISEDHLSLLVNSGVVIRRVNGLTKGQAASALISISSELNGSCIIGTCDSLVYPKIDVHQYAQSKTMGVWVTKPTDFATTHPKQFGWVSLNPDRTVRNTWVKSEPAAEDEVLVITGTFFFANDSEASELLGRFLKEGTTVNGEYYLDSVLKFAMENDWKVFALIPEWFVSLGTPEEYETYRYWESLFNVRADLLAHNE